MALLALFPLIMIGTVLVVELSIHGENFAWDGTSTLSKKPAKSQPVREDELPVAA